MGFDQRDNCIMGRCWHPVLDAQTRHCAVQRIDHGGAACLHVLDHRRAVPGPMGKHPRHEIVARVAFAIREGRKAALRRKNGQGLVGECLDQPKGMQAFDKRAASVTS